MPLLPSVQTIAGSDCYSLTDAGGFIVQFERILHAHGITIESRSTLEEVCLQVAHWEDRRQRRIAVDPREDIRISGRRGLSLVDLVRRLIRHQHRPDFAGLVPHMRLLNTSFAQNEEFIVEQRLRDSNNKVFELLIALVCMDVGTDVALDHPRRSSNGRNPDVLVTIDGRRWGFACKMLGGPSALTHFENLVKGVSQINASSAEVGCVVFGLKNLVPHDAIWPVLNPEEFAAGGEPIFRMWTDGRPLEILQEAGDALRQRLEAVNGTPAVRELFASPQNRCALPSALLFVQSATSFAFQEGPVPSHLNLFTHAQFVAGTLPAAFHDTLRKLNFALHHR